MIKNIYSMYDTAVKAYMQPIFADATGGLIRELTDLLKNQDHAFTKHPEDYTLFQIGTYDEKTAEIIPCNPTKIIGMWELVEPESNQSIEAQIKAEEQVVPLGRHN